MRLLKKPEVLKLTAKSNTTHYNDINEGLMTPPVRLGLNSVAWPEHEIVAINAARIAAKTNAEIKELVIQLVEQRKGGE